MDIGTRIYQARARRGYSLRDLGGLLGLSQTAINKYEKGQIVPDSAMLCRLGEALGVKPSYFVRPVRVGEIKPSFRKKASMSVGERKRVIEDIRDWLERYLDLVQIVGNEAEVFQMPEGFPCNITSPESAEAAADNLRAVWKIGLDPIESLTMILESRNIMVGEVVASNKFDACTFCIGEDNEQPVVVTRHDLPGDRQRFNLAHELGHLLLEIDAGIDEERACHRFAGALIAPADLVRADLGEHRKRIELQELYVMKHRYGISMQALLRRAFDLEIISRGVYDEYCRWFSNKGYRQVEPGDPVEREEPTRFALYALRAKAEGLITARRAEELLGRPLPTTPSFELMPL